VVDFRSDWALLSLPLRFRTDNIRFAAGSRANRCFLRENVVLTKRQQRVLFLFVRKRSDSNSTDVGHEGVITGRDAFSLRSSIANPPRVAQSPLQSTYPH